MPAVKKQRPVRKMLDLDKVIVRREFQPREDGVNADHVEGFRETIRSGKKIPDLPLVYLVRGEGAVLVRGHHQVEAAKLEGKTQWQFQVMEGPWSEAVIAAACSNSTPEHATGPLRMTNADKRRAVGMIMDVAPRMSVKDIVAKMGGLVSDQLVYDMKRERRIATGEIVPDEEGGDRLAPRVGRPPAVSNIGKEPGRNGDGHGPNGQVQVGADWSGLRQLVGQLTRSVQGVVASHPAEANSGHHQGARRLLDEFNALMFGNEQGQGGWMQKLNKKGE